MLMALVGMIALTACASGEEERLSRAEFLRQADAICATYARRLDAIPEPRTLRDVPAYVERGVPLAEEELSELEDLRPPEPLEPEVGRLLDSVRTTIAALERLGEAAASRERDETQTAATEVEEASVRAARLADELGLERCAPGP